MSDEGDKAALKLITFMQATNTLPLPEPQSEYDKRQQTTFDILNGATPGAGAKEVEFFHSREENLTSIPPSDVNAGGSISKTIKKMISSLQVSAAADYITAVTS